MFVCVVVSVITLGWLPRQVTWYTICGERSIYPYVLQFDGLAIALTITGLEGKASSYSADSASACILEALLLVLMPLFTVALLSTTLVRFFAWYSLEPSWLHVLTTSRDQQSILEALLPAKLGFDSVHRRLRIAARVATLLGFAAFVAYTVTQHAHYLLGWKHNLGVSAAITVVIVCSWAVEMTWPIIAQTTAFVRCLGDPTALSDSERGV